MRNKTLFKLILPVLLWLLPVAAFSNITIEDISGKVGDEVISKMTVSPVKSGDTLTIQMYASNPTVFFLDSITAGNEGEKISCSKTKIDFFSFELRVIFDEVNTDIVTLNLCGELLAGNENFSRILLSDIAIGETEFDDTFFEVTSENELNAVYVRPSRLGPSLPTVIRRGETIKWNYYVENESFVEIAIFDFAGRRVDYFSETTQGFGIYEHTFTAESTLSSGMYLITLLSDFGYDTQYFFIQN
jgi:hypothetical protein